MEPAEEPLRCSFCGKGQNEIRKLIAGQNANVCDECVEVCVDIIADDSRFTGPDGQTVARETIEQTTESGLVLRCALCGLPAALDEAVLVPERGALCPGCVGEVEAAIAVKRGEVT